MIHSSVVSETQRNWRGNAKLEHRLTIYKLEPGNLREQRRDIGPVNGINLPHDEYAMQRSQEKS